MRSSATRNAPGRARPWLVALSWLLAPSAFVWGAEPMAGVLHLANGGSLPGTIRDSDRPGVLRWQAPTFTDPFDFAVKGVKAIEFRRPADLTRPVADYSFELAGGDVVSGSLVALGEDEAVLDVPVSGRLHVRRSRISRIDRRSDRGGLIYLGPDGLTGWQALGGGWREEEGALVTDQAGVALRGDFGLPARASIEFVISWKNWPNFSLALGVDDQPSTIQHAFRFEVWNLDLVAYRETDDDADVASLARVAPVHDRAHLLAYLDQERGRLLVDSPDGHRLADLKVPARQSRVCPGVVLANIVGNVKLERLRIGRWDGVPPPEIRADTPRLQRGDGSIVTGQVTRYDATSKEFVVRAGSGEVRVPEDQVASVFLPASDDDRPRSIRAVGQDGTRLSGDLARVEQGAVWLSLPGVEESLRLPLADLRALVVLHPEPPTKGRGEGTGTLEVDGLRVPGRLVDGQAQAGASCLAWQPQGSTNASPLRPGASGRIIFREPPPRPAPAAGGFSGTIQLLPAPAPPAPLGGGPAPVGGFMPAPPPPPAPQPPGAIVNAPAVIVRRMPTTTRTVVRSPQLTTGGRPALHLRTGDVVPAEVTKIDEHGVWFRSPFSHAIFVTHDKVKAVVLANTPRGTDLSPSKRERLLTLPRMQKENPPTHLIHSRNGDYLRGRVLALDDKDLRVEVRLESKDVPRDRIAEIIWLHADELDAAGEHTPPPDAGEANRVQALRGDGRRLTIVADRLADHTLFGKSDVLGDCRVRLSEVDQLLFGGAIEQAAAQLAYQQWTLHNADEPKAALGDGAGSATGRAPGTESALVGKPAPDFALELLEGKTFRLAESKGKVVVLDFWATWCGPCLQAMPQVDRVTREFQDRGVQLVAVNLQEAPKPIAAMLERHKLQLTVALDRDGAVAAKYGANAIPQTVVIDRDGNIARLFVGGGPHLGDQLRAALDALLPGEKPDGRSP